MAVLTVGGLVLVAHHLRLDQRLGSWLAENSLANEDSGADAPTPPDAAAAEQTERPAPAVAPRPAAIHVTSEPPGARITYCGRPTDKTTPARLTARGGSRCAVRLELAEHEPYETTVHARAGRTARVSATLTPIPKVVPDARPSEGVLLVTSIHVGDVLVNGSKVGLTPRLDLPLPPGTYSVEVHLENLGTVLKRTVQIRAGRTTRVHVDPAAR